MPVASLILSCFLLAQVPADGRVMPTAEPSPPAALEPIPDPATRGAGPAVTIPPRFHRSPPPRGPQIQVSDDAALPPQKPAPPAEKPAQSPAKPEGSHGPLPPDRVAAMLKLPGDTIAGRPLTLMSALANAFERTQRLAITHAYWQLTDALAEYCLCFKENERLRQLQVRPEDAALLRAAQASAEAALRAAEVAVAVRQHELAEAVGLSSQDPLPLPADLPHVGPYRTHFDEVAARQSLPPRARLIDRMLPIRRKAIDVWASAVQAAEDATQAITDAYQQKATDLATVLEYNALLGRRQRTFLASVCDYNHDIADYAMAVAGPEITGPTLVGMLIKTNRPAEPRTIPNDRSKAPKPLQGDAETALPRDSSVQPATFVPVPSEQPSQPPTTTGVPTLAPPREQVQPSAPGQPTLAPPRKKPTVVDTDVSAVVAPAASPPTIHTANRPVSVTQTTAGLYPGLVTAKPTVRMQRLAQALHANRSLPSSNSKPIELRDCLRPIGSGDHQDVIVAYWFAQQRAAEYQALVMHAGWLEELLPFALERHNRPGGPEEMLRLQAARLAAKGSLLDAELRLLDAQFELTRLAGSPADTAWLSPATAPHAGPYLLRLEAQPPQLAASWPMKRLAATIPALITSLEDRAVAVVEADLARAAVVGGYQAGDRPIDDALAALNQQTTETCTFLETLTDYNRFLADYVLTVLPMTVPTDQLVNALVVP